MPAFRPGSFLSRLETAGRSLFQKRDYPPPSLDAAYAHAFGLPPSFRAEQTQQAYTDNPWLYSAVNVISHEVARTDFRLYKKKKNGEPEEVTSHQALETLSHPQPLESGKTMLTRYQMLFL